MAPFQNSLLLLPLLLLMRNVDVSVEPAKTYVYIGYAVSTTLILLVHLYCYWQVQVKKDQTIVVVPPEKSMFNPNPTEEPKRITVQEYDTTEIKKAIQQTVVLVVISGFLVYQWSLVQPLFMQAVLGLKSAISANHVWVHIMGKPAVGDLARPWLPENPFASMMGQTQARTEAAPAISGAETTSPEPTAAAPKQSKKEKRSRKQD